MVRRIRDKRSKAAVRGWTTGARNAPLGFNRTRPVDRLSEERDRLHVGVSQSRRIRDCTPPTLGLSCRLQRGVQPI